MFAALGSSDEGIEAVNGKSIMEKSFERYASLASYQDIGEVDVKSADEAFKVEFKTYYRKPIYFASIGSISSVIKNYIM
jgi:hypothetical protein